MPPENGQSAARGSRDRGPPPGTGDRRRICAYTYIIICNAIALQLAQGMGPKRSAGRRLGEGRRRAQQGRSKGAKRGATRAQTRGAARAHKPGRKLGQKTGAETAIAGNLRAFDLSRG